MWQTARLYPYRSSNTPSFEAICCGSSHLTPSKVRACLHGLLVPLCIETTKAVRDHDITTHPFVTRAQLVETQCHMDHKDSYHWVRRCCCKTLIMETSASISCKASCTYFWCSGIKMQHSAYKRTQVHPCTVVSKSRVMWFCRTTVLIWEILSMRNIKDWHMPFKA